MKRSTLALLALLPAVVTLFPAELFGIDASYLQRLPILGPNGFPYWEPLLFLLVMMGLMFPPPKHGQLAYAVGAVSVVLALAYVLLRASGPVNQSLGLFLQFSSVAALALTANAENPIGVASRLERALVVGGVFALASSALLTFSAFGIDGWWTEALVRIERFEGLDERMRWEVVRPQDRLLMAFFVAYCVTLAFQRRSWFLFAVPVLFLAAQLIQSSRGGLILVVSAILVGALLGSRVVLRKPRSVFLRGVVVAIVLSVVASSFILLSGRARVLLSTSAELTDESGIRNRMYAAALDILEGQMIWGVGYIDLHTTHEWSPFILSNMLLPLHNMYMQAWLYEGLPGLLLWLIPSWLAVKAAVTLLVNYSSINSGTRPLVAGMVAVLPAFLYMMLLQTLDRVSLVLGWMLLGCIIALARAVRRQEAS